MVKFLDLNHQYQRIKSDIDTAIAQVIQDTAFIGGAYVTTFEQAFATYLQVNHVVGVANGTDALEIAIESLDLPKESEIIVPANSFIASAEAVTRMGHRVVFCDCNPDDYTLSIASVRAKVTSKTKAIIAVHLYGHPCDMDALREIAADYSLKIIEDGAQAHGAEYKGSRVGTMGDIGTFSFYPGKNLGAYGDGGTIVTNNERLATRCRMIANHGRLSKYNHEFEGRNSRLDGLQAAILTVKLAYLDQWTAARIAVADRYLEQLKTVSDIILPVRQQGVKQVYHLFVIRTQYRDHLKEALAKQQIQTGIHYPIALPKLNAYQYLGQANESFIANQIDSQLLSLPMGEHLSQDDVDRVIEGVLHHG